MKTCVKMPLMQDGHTIDHMVCLFLFTLNPLLLLLVLDNCYWLMALCQPNLEEQI